MNKTIIGVSILLAASANAQTSPMDVACKSVSAQTCNAAATMGRGVNLGELLDAPLEGGYGARLEPDFIEKATSVFKTIRLPVRFSNHAAETQDATLDDFFAGRVDNVVDALLAKDVYVILDFHGYNQLGGGAVERNEVAVAPDVVDQRFLNIWSQLAARYRSKSPKLMFELFNEPGGRLDGAKWNSLAAQGLAAIRKIDPERIVLIGPSNGNHSRGLIGFTIPKDANLIVPIHNYDPFDFTHQGTSWTWFKDKTGVTCCTAVQKKAVTDALDTAKRWSLQNGYPITVGEFGTYGKADMDSRVQYTRMFRDEAEKRGFSWTYWNFTGSFGVYSAKEHVWIAPIRGALLD